MHLKSKLIFALIATGVAVVDNSTSAASIRPTYWMPSLHDE